MFPFLRSSAPQLFSVICILFLLSGCSIVSEHLLKADPGAQLTKQDTKTQQVMDELALQSLVISMADEYVSAVSEVAFLHLRPQTENSQERVLVQSLIRNSFGAATEIAASRNSDVAMLDLLVLVTLQRKTFENYWIPKIWGPERSREALKQLKLTEENLWQRASKLLTPSHQSTLRELIDTWLVANPDRLVVELIRFDAFADARWMPQQHHRDAAKGLLQEIDSAVSTIDDALQFGERAMWYSGRLAYIAGEQAELSAYRILAAPEIQEALDQIQAAQKTFTEFQATLTSYPELMAAQQIKIFSDLRQEREMAINQLFERIAQERAQLFDSISTSGEQVEQMLPTTLELIKASADLAKQTNQASLSIDRLMARFDENSNTRQASDTASSPLELIQASSHLAAQLQLLLPQLKHDIDTVDNMYTQALDQLFWRLVALVILIFSGIAALRLIPNKRRA